MIVKATTQEQLEQWKAVWEEYKDRLKPNRKTGGEVLAYLRSRYSLTEVGDQAALQAISENVTENQYLREKLPKGRQPDPRAFYLENCGEGEKFYSPENRDDPEVWGGTITRIFIGVDLSSGFYMVEGSTMLWDELCAFQGVDERDLENFVIVAEYVNALRRFGTDGFLSSSVGNRK